MSVRSAGAVDAVWLAGVLQEDGYAVSLGGERTVLARRPGRPNIQLTVHHELGLITIRHYWHLRAGGFTAHLDLLEKINLANSESWRDTFYIDPDGDLSVTSYITLAEQLSSHDVTWFLAQESDAFAVTLARTGLVDHVL